MIAKVIKRLVNKKISIDHDIAKLLEGPWAIGSDDKEILVEEILRFRQYGKINILEFGSGASTLVILKAALNHFNSAHLDVVENDLQWIERVQKLTDKYLRESINDVSLNYIQCNFDREMGFAIGAATDLKPTYDIILIDSPPDTSVADGRLLLMKRVMLNLHEKGVLIVHDTNRNAEQYGFWHMSRKFYDSQLYNTGKGIGVLRFPYKVDVQSISS